MNPVWQRRIGWSLTGIFSLFMLVASIAPKLAGIQAVGETMEQLGWPPQSAFMIGCFELAFLALYLLPRTEILGAILMSVLIGGAIATQMRVANPLFSHVLFGVYLALFMWGGLWLRDPRLRALFPLRTAGDGTSA